ncbi:hypothetical protein [Rathayibacter iranicus]|uniref:Transcription regulator HTH AraC- type ligand binding domain-containing protein n=2 Tax=Rathayibacter iranicus TaxID=59737 RepID=A0AAD1AGE2_9MICO|nr:hypothetical protein [Rathayibacter iranicus]AZZ56770.1 hypothetical protein C7V51_13470 [Rathayibacter iranicus]MWV32500.1 hypothetical protein [Rathayibacter iranicus NCPPB 2253 = VKM Ac-1602]PPI42877.1 hypothetical protein C5E09_12385 [Rathayibacter iranicus]PPI58159.1 hypothetical protein C5E08_13295 [Rathayibacter iranicus]PPI69158.1 hypothetical protein C5E01_12340 [Rathayibacter iranicus]
MDDDHRHVRLQAGGGDPDEARHRLARLYNGDDWRAATTGSDFTYRYAAIGDSGMTLRISRMSERLADGVGDSGDVVVQWIVSGRARIDLGTTSITMEPHRPVLFPVDRPFSFDYLDFDQRLGRRSRVRRCGVASAARRDQVEHPRQAPSERQALPAHTRCPYRTTLTGAWPLLSRKRSRRSAC